MMFTNSIIHLLEVITLLMVGAFFVQLSRCYLHFSRTAVTENVREAASKRANAHSMKVIVNISSSTRESKVVSEKPEVVYDSSKSINVDSFDLVSNSTEFITSEGCSHGQILNDYIGEFFTESAPTNIDQFRSSSQSMADRDVTSQESRRQSEQNEAECLDEIIVVESQEKIQAVILENESLGLCDSTVPTEIVPVEPLMDDDSVITVADASMDKTSQGRKVMSDRVVHAMLDEARLACSS